MQALRNAHRLARLVLVWFVMYVGAAVASPLVNPVDIQFICSGLGAVKVLPDGGSTAEVPGHTLACPLCMASGAPPQVAMVLAQPAQPLAHAMRGIASPHMAWLSAAPLPARGPPAFF